MLLFRNTRIFNYTDIITDMKLSLIGRFIQTSKIWHLQNVIAYFHDAGKRESIFIEIATVFTRK